MGFLRSKKKKKVEEVEEVPEEEMEEEESEDLEDEEEVEEVKPSKKKERFMVVKELPVQPIRQIEDPNTGDLINLKTMEEAFTDLMNGEL